MFTKKCVSLQSQKQDMQQDRLWNANYWKVMVANFTMFFSGYLLMPLLPLYLSEQFGATKDTIGLVLAGYIVSALLVRPFSGYLADSFPRKKVLLLALALNAAVFGGYLVAGSLLLFFIVRTLHGAPFGTSSVANSTVAIDVLPSSRRTEGIGYYGLSNNFGTAIAPTVGIYVYGQTHNFQLLFVLAMVVALVGFAVDATVKLPERQLMQNRKKLSLDRFFLVRGWAVGLNVAVFGFCYGVLCNYLAIYSKETLGITAGTGAYFAILSGGLILSRIQGGRALRQGRIVQNAAEGILVSTLGYLLFATVHHTVAYYGSALLIGLGNGHMWPSMQNMIVDLAEHNERGTANSTLLTGWDLGMGLGILLGGIIAEHVGYTAAFTTVAAVHFVGVALFFAATRKDFLRNRLR